MIDRQAPFGDEVLRIVTLGSAAAKVCRGEQEIASLRPGKPLALLTYLACEARSMQREHLVDLLWSHVDRARGRQSLRQTLLQISKGLGIECIAGTRETVGITGEVILDRAEFFAAIQRQDYDTAVSLYAGEFLPNLALPGGVEFDHWVDGERARMRRAFRACGEALVRRRLATARHREAVSLARKIRDVHPESEAIWRLLLEALISSGDLVMAATEAESLLQRLSSDGREPEPATRNMMREAQASATGSVGPKKALTTELVGRASEFSALLSAWELALKGQFTHVHILAPAGLGKTRLVTDFYARLRSQSASISLVNLRYGDRDVLHSALGKIASSLAHHRGAAGISPASARSLVALDPALSSCFPVESDEAQGEEALRRRASAVFELLSAISEERATALIIDDVHWMDEASSRTLASILQRFGHQQILTITTSRPRYPVPVSSTTQQVQLHAFKDEEIVDLLSSVATLPPEYWARDLVRGLYATTGGVPLSVIEALRLMLERGMLALEKDTWVARNADELTKLLARGWLVPEHVATLPAAERRVVVALAVAGVPIVPDMIAEATRLPTSEIERASMQLEQSGLVVSTPEGLHIGHDTIGESILESIRPDEANAAHSALGDAYLARSSNHRRHVFHAAVHFVASKDVAGLRRAMRQRVVSARTLGDVRPTIDLATELLGGGNDVLAASALAASVPWRIRVSNRAKVRGLFAASMLAAVGGFAMRSPAPGDLPDAVLVAFPADSTGATGPIRLELHERDLTVNSVIDLRNGRHADVVLPPDPGNADLSPDGREWASQRVFADSGGIDLVIVDPKTGRERRLTNSPADDFGPSWSPDMSRLAFATGRFDSLRHSDIAIVDMKTLNVRQVTSGPESDTGARWSPSGARIAFTRSYWTDARVEVCTIGLDGGNLECTPPANGRELSAYGWFDDHWLIVWDRKGETGRIGLLNIETHELRDLWDGRVGEVHVSPNGQWLVCSCARKNVSTLRWLAFPVRQSELAREVILDRLGTKLFTPMWLGPTRPRHYLARLEIEAPASGIALAASSQLSVRGVDAVGRAVSGIRTHWSVSPTDVATIDTVSGLLHPLKLGKIRVRASADGWALADTSLQVIDLPVARVLTEDWNNGIEPQFTPFGVPRPTVEPTTLGPAVSINGDASFSSGLYGKAMYDARAGIGMEAVVSTPISSPQWQNVQIVFTPDVDSATLAKWDHRTGDPPGISTPSKHAYCAATIPAAEGANGQRRIAATNASRSEADLPSAVVSGRPFRIRVQLFPDGRCGIAIDGIPVLIAPGTGVDERRYRLLMDGKAFHTKILIGRVEVWSGVRPDVDWHRLELIARK